MRLNQRMYQAGLDAHVRRYVRQLAEGSVSGTNYSIQCLNWAGELRRENNLASARIWISDARHDRQAGSSILPLPR